MKNAVCRLTNINYRSIADINYKEQAYEILDQLTREELKDIILSEEMNWVNIYSTDKYLKQEIYDVLVRFRCERQVLGEVAAKSYYE